MQDDLIKRVEEIQAISAVPTILETVAALTGLRFVCIAHVTDDSWTACAVLDRLDFGLVPGGTLDVTTTLCEEVRDTARAVVIDSVEGSERYREHHTPRLYGFQSYFSIPVFRTDGSYFGTLCGLDPEPARLTEKATVSTLHLFAELVSKQLDADSDLVATRAALLDERETAELREQFIAVLGHDLRTPLGAILLGTDILKHKHADPASAPVVERIRRSATRIASLVDDVVDFTRGRMGSGIPMRLRDAALDGYLEQVVDELRGLYPERVIDAVIVPGLRLHCDPERIAQLLSNLLKNALVHGFDHTPVAVRAAMAGDEFILSVTNQGRELARKVIDQLFKPYWRASSRSGNEGLGLGLYIVDQIARAHDGSIDVHSDGGSTSFVFRMRAADAAGRGR
ncbi:GAF domain-containing sensor histidine kinase [Massilia sp. Dwa41.01b]|uniref:GAF domain-containing sensor histidine kinase n=1 Tax=unclassified Massilia TaxID=2609279 RepID=UPI001601B107|nr:MULTISPECIES: ATP-binding protein [unclassified Massilia]QNA90265.1 GAF domain-containing sensor histidine kinase [Massilia sp. Dwa41.01b]QNB01164.1 GAF domain-containing sensor histidine kinase [Massilia sp. Se16.2.3]